MGKPPDFDINDIEPAKWYCVIADGFIDESEKTGCDQDYFMTGYGCVIGQTIIDWLNSGEECTDGTPIVSMIGNPAQKLVEIGEPYDTIGECQDVCL